MSVIVIARATCDTEKFVELFTSHKDVFERVAEQGRSMGAIHHRFFVGDGEAGFVDEWDSAESFQAFFQGNDEIPGLMQAAAFQPPDIAVYQAVDSPDLF